MRVFGSWWERIPVREAASKLIAVAAVLAVVAHASAISHMSGVVGWIWG